MGKLSRNKGACGEREFILLVESLCGIRMQRNLLQTQSGGHDLLGLPGYAVEVKRTKPMPRSAVVGWWQQAVDQAARIGAKPVLAYRFDRCDWRVVIHGNNGFKVEDYNGCCEVSAEYFCKVLEHEQAGN